MNIVSKATAMNILTDSLFRPVNGHTLSIAKFDGGKYEWKGSAKAYLGKECPNLRGIHAVYVERRQDRDGPFAQIMCVCED